MRRLLAIVLAVGLLTGACGDDGDSSGDDDKKRGSYEPVDLPEDAEVQDILVGPDVAGVQVLTFTNKDGVRCTLAVEKQEEYALALDCDYESEASSSEDDL